MGKKDNGWFEDYTYSDDVRSDGTCFITTFHTKTMTRDQWQNYLNVKYKPYDDFKNIDGTISDVLGAAYGLGNGMSDINEVATTTEFGSNFINTSEYSEINKQILNNKYGNYNITIVYGADVNLYQNGHLEHFYSNDKY